MVAAVVAAGEGRGRPLPSPAAPGDDGYSGYSSYSVRREWLYCPGSGVAVARRKADDGGS